MNAEVNTKEAVNPTEEITPTPTNPESKPPEGATETVQAQDPEPTLNQEDNPNPEHAEEPIDQAVVEELNEMFNSAMASKFFMRNPKRIKSLKDALKIPISDDKSFQLIFYHAEIDLEREASKIAKKNRTVPQDVTISDIVAEAQKRYVAKHKKPAIVNEEYAGR